MLKNYKDAVTVILGVVSVFGSFVLADRFVSFWGEFNINHSSLVYSSVNQFSGEKDIDFGRLSYSDGPQKYLFRLNNRSGREVVISKVYTSCACVRAYIHKGTESYGWFSLSDRFYTSNLGLRLSPLDNFSVSIYFDPSFGSPFSVGLIEPFIVLEDGYGYKTFLRISALVIP